MYIYLVIFRFLVKIHCVVFILKLINSDYVFVLFQVMASQDFIYYNGVHSHMQKQARKEDHNSWIKITTNVSWKLKQFKENVRRFINTLTSFMWSNLELTEYYCVCVDLSTGSETETTETLRHPTPEWRTNEQLGLREMLASSQTETDNLI